MLDGEGGVAEEDVLGNLIGGADFKEVLAGSERGERNEALDGELFAGLAELARGLFGAPDFLCAFQDAIENGGAGFVRGGVGLEIVELDEDAHFFRGGEGVVEAWADFARTDDEGTESDLAGRDGLHEVGEDERASIEIFVVIARDTEGGADDAHVAAGFVFHDEVEAVEAWAEGDGFLVEAVEIQGGLKEGAGKIARDGFVKSLHDAASG